MLLCLWFKQQQKASLWVPQSLSHCLIQCTCAEKLVVEYSRFLCWCIWSPTWTKENIKRTNDWSHVPVWNVNLALYCVKWILGRTRSSSVSFSPDVLAVDGPLAFLDLLMMQACVICMIILHVHVEHLCLCLCMSKPLPTVPEPRKCTVLKLTLVNKLDFSVSSAQARYGVSANERGAM